MILLRVSKKVFEVFIHVVTEVTLPGSFNGKSTFRPLLCVHYCGDDGPDAMAWAVREPQQWKAAIENLVRQGRTSATCYPAGQCQSTL